MSESTDNKEAPRTLPSFGSVFVAGARGYSAIPDATTNNHTPDNVASYLNSSESVRNALQTAAVDSPKNHSSPESISNISNVNHHGTLTETPRTMTLPTAMPTTMSQMYPLNLSETSMHVATRNYLLTPDDNQTVATVADGQATTSKIARLYTDSPDTNQTDYQASPVATPHVQVQQQIQPQAYTTSASDSPHPDYTTSAVAKASFTPSPDSSQGIQHPEQLVNDFSGTSTALTENVSNDAQSLIANQGMYGGFSETALRNYAASISALARNYPMFDQNYAASQEMAKDFARNSFISAENLIRRYIAATRGNLGQTVYTGTENHTTEAYQPTSHDMSAEQKLQAEMAAFSAAMGIPYSMTASYGLNNTGQNDQPLGLTTSNVDHRVNNINPALSPTTSHDNLANVRSDEGLLAEDMSIKTEPDPFLCKACHETFTDKESLELHMKRHSGDKPYECTHCHKKFAIQSRLRYHIRKHESPLQCTECGKYFTEKFDLAVHMNIHSGDNQYACDICQERFDSSTSLQFHKKIHDGEQSLKCSTCEASFTQYADLQRHLKVHSSMIVVTCPQCEGRIPREKYEVHARQCGKDRIWKCRRCKTCFASQLELHAHREVHKDDKPFQCPICHKRFSHKCNLDVHNRTHTGERPYTCTYCGKKFTQSGTLKAHVRTHTGEKPYVCDFCQKAFAVKANLDTHRRIHTGERPYKCDKCGMRFSQSNTLKSHRKTHT